MFHVNSRRFGRTVGALVGCLVALSLLIPAVPAAATPANDNFASAKQLRGKRVQITGTTAGATREANEPDHYTDPVPGDADFWVGDHSVWYRWKAPASGRVTLDTCNAQIDSILAVYTGGQLASLQRITDNNNSPGCPAGSWGSKVTFRAKEGKTYRIAVADCGGAPQNSFTLRLKLS
jgi:hypothetical protein